MSTIIKAKRSSVQGKVPITTDLELGEFAINTYDGKLFTKKNVNGTESIVDLSLGTTNLGYSANSTAVTVTSDTGSDINILAANGTIAGVLTAGAQTIAGAKTFTGDILFNNNSGGGGTQEGGEIQLAAPTANTTLSGPIAIDIFQNRLRIFETSGTNRGVYMDLTTAASTVGTNLLAGSVTNISTSANGSTVTVLSDTGSDGIILAANSTTAGVITAEAQTIGGAKTFSGNITANQVSSTNNGAGTNFQVGDDAWIGDINLSNTIRITGQQDATQGYLVFGNSSNTALGRTGTGSLTYGGSAIILASDTASAATASKVVIRDSSSNFAANTITAALAGNATTATTLQTARTISLGGDLSGSATFDGSANVTITATIGSNSVALGTDTTGNYVASITNGSYITGGNGGSEGAALTLAVDAATAATASKVVARDASSNFSANTITAALAGNATTATTLQTARTIGGVSFDGSANINLPGVNTTGNQNTTGSAATLTTARTIALSGDVAGSATFDGSANVTITATIQSNSVALGTDTTGNYVAGLTGGTGVTISGTAGEGWSPTVAIGQAVSTTSDVEFRNLVLSGNLTVNGTSTTVNATELAIEDNLIYLNDGSTITNPDIGIVGNYNDGTYAHTGVFRDATDGRWKFFKGYVPEPGQTIDTANATFQYADVQANTVYAALSGNATTATTLQTARTIGGVSFDGSANINLPGVNTTGNQNTTGSAATLTTARTIAISGDVTGTATSFNGSANITISAGITANTIVNADINTSAAIADTKLATISTAGKVSNSATTATNLNTASAIVARDASGNFTAGTITAALTGAASSNVLKAGDTMTGKLNLAGNDSARLIESLNTSASSAVQFYVEHNLGATNVGNARGVLNLVSNGALTIGGSVALTAGNFNTYAPTLTGTGASGNWGINITGNAATVTNGALTTGTLAQFAATTSAQLAGVISDETGSGALVFGTAPTFTTSINGGATFGAFASSTALTLGYTGTAASTINISTGATATTVTKTVNLGTGGAAGSTTNINIGSSVAGTTTISSPNITISGLADTATTATHYYVETASGNILPKTLANARTELVTTAAVNSAAATTVGTVTVGTWNATAITDTYLATISTAGKVSNSATTATNAATANAIVARDASGNFSANTITAALTGTASNATTLDSNAETSYLRYRGTITETTVNDTTTDASRTSGWYRVSYTGASDALLDIGGIGGSTPRVQFRFNYDDSIWFRSARDTETTWDSVTSRGKLLLHSSNFNTYAPTLTGTGASGTWNIAVTNGALTTGNLSQFAATTSAQLAGVISDETGSGALVFGTSPSFTTGINAASTTMALFDTTATTVNFAGAATTGNFGYDGTAASTTNLSVGATVSGSTKTVNVGTAGASGSITNINIGSATAGAVGNTVINSTSLIVPGNMSLGANILATTGPILTLGTLVSGGSGFMNGTHTNQLFTGGTGAYMLATVTVALGVITGVTLTWGGNRYSVADVLTAPVLTTTLATTAASGTGTTATITFAAQAAAPFEVGSQIIVAGVTPTGYNGTFTVTACTTTSVSYANATTGAQTIAGTVKMGNSLTASTIPVATVQGTDLYISSYTSDSIGARIRLEANDTSTVAGQEYGAITFGGRDASANGSGDLALIRGVGAGTAGGSDLQFWTGANGAAPTISAVITSGSNFRLYNAAGTFYSEFSNSPTANRTLTVPDVTGTVSVIQSVAAAGYFDTSATTPTGTTRLNYGGYLYPTFLNLVGSGDTATAATHYYVEIGSDGFVRPKTLANVQTEIVTSAVLGSGTANTSTYLRGDRSWATVTSGITITDDTTTNATRYLTFTSATSGSISGENVSSTKLTFNPSTGDFTAAGDITSTSDIRVKTNIRTIEDALVLVQNMRGVYFNKNGIAGVGVIAQEMEEVLPEVVLDGEYKSVAYGNIVGVLIEAIKDQNETINTMESDIEELKALVKKLMEK